MCEIIYLIMKIFQHHNTSVNCCYTTKYNHQNKIASRKLTQGNKTVIVRKTVFHHIEIWADTLVNKIMY